MSAPVTLHKLRLEPLRLSREPRALRALYWIITACACSLVVWGLQASLFRLREDWATYLCWTVAIALAEFMSVPVYRTVVLTMSLPVVLAAGMLFPPEIVGLLALAGFIDTREFRGEISLGRGVYNRSQVAIAATAASVAFHAVGGSVDRWPVVVVACLLALLVDWLINCAFVVAPTRLSMGVPMADVLRRFLGDRPGVEALGYLCLGLLALPLALTFSAVGKWGLVSFLVPLFLARQTFAHGRRLEAASGIVEAKQQALAHSVEDIARERRDERRVVAGDLHDDVLQPLYKVHLMGEVLKRDLDSGRLLDLDRDLPDLLTATNAAQNAIRHLIRSLRQSALGSGGLVNTLNLLVADLSSTTSARIHLEAQEVGGAATAQLIAYQAVREALQNSVRHSSAGEITVRLWRDDDAINGNVEDDGVGFDPALIDATAHFGLQLAKERVEAGGGTLRVTSTPGHGTAVSVSLPAEGPWQV
jgi:signal transduction histidine kinase